MRAIVYSFVDPAGKGIATKLREHLRCRELRLPKALSTCIDNDLNVILAGFNEDVIYFDFLDEVFSKFNVDYYIVLSRHSASSGIKSLTTHHTGNFTDKALAGGNPYELGIANPPLALKFLKELHKVREEYSLTDFEVTYEVTHHGPTSVSKPLTFIEIGSTPSEWILSKAHEALSLVVLSSLTKPLPQCIPSVGIGGPHYASMFSERSMKYNECYGHIIARYALNELKGNVGLLKEMIVKAINKSLPRAENIVMHKKVGRVVKDAVRSIASNYKVNIKVV